MPYYCTVPRCTSMAGKAKNVSFHQFPRDEELARLWNDILKRGKPYTKYSKVCSLHFRPEDYTITSVGKNKGQWRTLRKDAIPSQNLPSESPAPFARKHWESWGQNACSPSVMDPTIQQQMAQAIYMQTMLAMQASGTTENHQNGPPIPEMAQTSTQDKETSSDSISYKCEECTKCFKDPDVFILHKRSHARDNSNGEKENFNMNLTLRSNPILANLLKPNIDSTFDPNLITMENLLMTALAANMDYIRNFSMTKERDTSDLNDSNQLNRDLNERDSDSDHISDSNDALKALDKRVLSYTQCLKNSRNEHDLNDDKYNLNHFNDSTDDQNIINHTKSDLNNQVLRKSEVNYQISDANHEKSDANYKKSDVYQKSDQIVSYAMNFSTKLSESESVKYSGNYYRERCSEYERDNSDADKNMKNVRSHCDNDLNESLDSNSLVIDENA